MKKPTEQNPNQPQAIAAITERGFVAWSEQSTLSPEFMQQFDHQRIPVLGVRQVQVWGLQVDDERELPGLERTSIQSEELWELILQAKDGSHYEVNARFVVPAP